MNDAQRDELLIRIDENVKAVARLGEDHEERIRSLETTKHKQAGMIVILSAICGGAWSYFTSGGK